ncbi:hypothetical protein NBRC10512_002277 [Rhodotorula toruloides]|uniref:RHTO0S08e06722g1_1 n=2 Tax=Rhodotorula toruloides TaxID=5286 RepID=A0A061B1Y0_RHOTO|nr:uncharacterized protein RHTO_00963 [Rhodotorula toruloides NP11]EMS22209.1 hypothetical protein RHTO_00963 [Rhodotorula toruloides NP11]CDR43837.1 RHTO0S08e06722g1_1 [Rhodotorula toruloides]
MSTAGPPPPATRRTVDLPAEIKALIIEHCHALEERWRERARYLHTYISTQDHLNEMRPGKSDLAEYLDKVASRPSLIGSLYRLSRSWSSAAAPERFSSLLVSQTGSFIFQQHILPRCAHHFRVVRFDALGTNRARFNAFLLLLPQLPNVDAALLTRSGFEEHLSETNTFDRLTWASLEDPLSVLARFLGRLIKLDVSFGDWTHINRVVQAASSLQILYLHDHPEDLDSNVLVDILQHLPNLRELAMETVDSEALNDAIGRLQGQKLPPLADFSVFVGWDIAVVLRFAHLFRNTLTHLTLAITPNSGGARDPINTTFPHLHTLRFYGEAGTSDDFFLGLSAQHLPVLSHLIVLGRDLAIQGVDDVLDFCDAFKRAGRPLREIQIVDPQSFLSVADLERIHGELDHPNTKITTAPCDNFLERLYLRPPKEAELVWPIDPHPIRLAVEQTVGFINDWLAQARNMEDIGAYARLAVVLQRAEVERVVMAP